MNQQHDKKDASRALKPWKSFEGNIADNVKQCNIVLYVVPSGAMPKITLSYARRQSRHTCR